MINILKDKIKLIVFDISGTLIDHGSLVTVHTFQKAFKKYKIIVRPELIIKDMGISKDRHIKKILKHSYIHNQIIKNKINEKNLYYNLKVNFDKILKTEVKNKFDYISGFNSLIKYLEKKNILIALTTGYPRPILNFILQRFKKEKKFVPDYAVSATDVKRGRPYNDMIIKILKVLKINKSNTIKIDDSFSGILEGKNAKVKTVGLTLSGINFLKRAHDRKKISNKIQNIKHLNLSKKFKNIETDFVLKDISELKNLLLDNFDI